MKGAAGQRAAHIKDAAHLVTAARASAGGWRVPGLLLGREQGSR